MDMDATSNAPRTKLQQLLSKEIAIAAENSSHIGSNSTNIAKEVAVASTAALVAAHFAKTTEAIGAKKQHISTTMSSTMSATSENHMLTITVAASTCNSYLCSFD
nr:hypothetical protein [Tanacetum cinerariifolium]